MEAVQHSVCLIDDEHELLDGFGAVLSANYKVYTFNSPLEALKAFDEGLDPTVVVSDLRMPEMGGLQMIEKIREKHLHSKIIVASGHADKSAAVQALNLGVDGFLEKPFTIRDFKEMIGRVAATKEGSDIHAIKENFQRYSKIYFERLAHAENYIFENGLPYPRTNEEKKQLISSMKEVRELGAKIEKQLTEISKT